jgi:O-antigen ligase
MSHAIPRTSRAPLALVAFFLVVAVSYGAVSAIRGGAMALLLFSPLFPAFLVLRDFRLGTAVFVLLVPLGGLQALQGFTGFNIYNYLILAIALSLFTRFYFQRFPLAPFPAIFWWAYIVPILLAALHGIPNLASIQPRTLALLGNSYGDPKAYLMGMVIKPLLIVPAAWAFGTTAMNSRKPQWCVAVLALATIGPALAILFYVAAMGFNLHTLAGSQARESLNALGLHANDYGILLGTSVAMLLFMLPSVTTALARAGLAFCLLCLLAALLLTFSRGGYVIVATAVISFAIVHKQPRYLFITVLVVTVGLALAPEAFWERITTGTHERTALSTGTPDALTGGRVWIWAHMLPEFWNHPLLGSGVGSTAWSRLAQSSGAYVNHPHNVYLRALLDMGVVGFGLLAWFTVYLLRNLQRIARAESTPPVFAALAHGTFTAMIGLLICGFTNGNYIAQTETSLVWAAIGLLLPYFPCSGAGMGQSAMDRR